MSLRYRAPFRCCCSHIVGIRATYTTSQITIPAAICVGLFPRVKGQKMIYKTKTSLFGPFFALFLSFQLWFKRFWLKCAHTTMPSQPHVKIALRKCVRELNFLAAKYGVPYIPHTSSDADVKSLRRKLLLKLHQDKTRAPAGSPTTRRTPSRRRR